MCRWSPWSSTVTTTAILWQLTQDKTTPPTQYQPCFHTHYAVGLGTLQSAQHTELTQAARALAAPARLGRLRMGLGLLAHMLFKAMND